MKIIKMLRTIYNDHMVYSLDIGWIWWMNEWQKKKLTPICKCTSSITYTDLSIRKKNIWQKNEVTPTRWLTSVQGRNGNDFLRGF